MFIYVSRQRHGGQVFLSFDICFTVAASRLYSRLIFRPDYKADRINSLGADGSDYRVRLDSDLTAGVLVNAVTTSTYLKMRRSGFDVSALRYEDLVVRPVDMCRAVLEFCGLPVSLAERGVKAFDVDSQRNSIVAKSLIGRFEEPQLTSQRKTKLNEMLNKYGVPLIGESNVVEVTLSCVPWIELKELNLNLYSVLPWSHAIISNTLFSQRERRKAHRP